MKISKDYKMKYKFKILLLCLCISLPIILQAQEAKPDINKVIEVTKEKDGTEVIKETKIMNKDGKENKEITITKTKTYVQNKDFTYMNGIGDKSYYSEMGVTPLGTIYAKERANINTKPFGGITIYACKTNWLNFAKTSCATDKSSFILGVTFGINQASDNKSIAYLLGLTVGYVINGDWLVGLTFGGFYDTVKTLPYPYRENFYHPLIQPGSAPNAAFTSYEIPLETKQGFFRGVGFTLSKKIEFQGDEDSKEKEPPAQNTNANQ